MARGRKRDSIHETPDVSFITNPDVAHEESDVAVRPLLWFVGGLTFFTVVVCLIVLLMFSYFLRREQSQELEASPLARQGEERLPPEPRLQLAPGWNVTSDDGQKHELDYTAKRNYVPQPGSEYLLVRDEWRHELDGYGWADQQAGTVRVPVDKAIDVYLQRQQAKQPPQQAQPGAQQQTQQGTQPGAAGARATPNATPTATPAGGKR